MIRRNIIVLILWYILCFANCYPFELNWKKVYSGVYYAKATLPYPTDVYVIKIDLQNKKIAFKEVLKHNTIKPGDGETTSSMARRIGAIAAINADYFGMKKKPWKYYHVPKGTVIIDGKIFKFNPRQNSIAISWNNYVEMGKWNKPQRWFYTVCSGGPFILRKGKIPKLHPSFKKLHPRTAVGISKDKSTMYWVVADGRRPDSVGMNAKMMGLFMKDLGAYNAIFLDGGGSSTMFVKGRVVNQPSENRERKIASILAIVPRKKLSHTPPEPAYKKIVTIEPSFIPISKNKSSWTSKFTLKNNLHKRKNAYMNIYIKGSMPLSIFINGYSIGNVQSQYEDAFKEFTLPVPSNTLREGENIITVVISAQERIKNFHGEFGNIKMVFK